jgi:hypothetical protein
MLFVDAFTNTNPSVQSANHRELALNDESSLAPVPMAHMFPHSSGKQSTR